MDHSKRYLRPSEAILICGSGARPICFSEGSADSVWGMGSSFVFNYRGKVFAVTAKHVIENQKANCQHTRILMLNTNVSLPIKSAFTPKFDEHINKTEIEDLLFFEIDAGMFIRESGLNLYSWDLQSWLYPTTKLEIGTELLIAGFPFTNEKYDFDNKVINELLLIRTANLIESAFGKDIYTMKGVPSEVSFNGLSGAPVFCRIEGFVYFCGIVIRGTSSSGLLHFIGSEVIYSALNLREANA